MGGPSEKSNDAGQMVRSTLRSWAIMQSLDHRVLTCGSPAHGWVRSTLRIYCRVRGCDYVHAPIHENFNFRDFPRNFDLNTAIYTRI